MSRLKTLTDYMTNAKNEETGCYGADSLLVDNYAEPSNFNLSPVAPSDTFPSLICKEIKECAQCCLNHTVTLEDICRDLELLSMSDETSKLEQGSLPLS